MDVQEKSIAIENGSMDYIKFGIGERTLVIIIGISMSGLKGLAKPISEAYKIFADDYTVYVFDRNSVLREGYTTADMACDTANAMKALGVLNADVIGISQGGMIAQVLAVYYPELVHSLALGSTWCRPDKSTHDIICNWKNLAEQKDYKGVNKDFFEKVYSEKFQKENRLLLAALNVTVSDEKYDRFRILTNACADFDFYDEIMKIQCSVFVIGSNKDKVASPDCQRELAEKIGAEIYMYDDYSHAVYDEAPDYKERVLSFFRKHR